MEGPAITPGLFLSRLGGYDSAMDTGENNLAALLRDMAPALDDAHYVFVVVPAGHQPATNPLMRFSESEGDTLILTAAAAQAAGLSLTRTFRRITLSVHSDLDAVGLTAAVARCLAEIGVAANVVAAYYHDHIFVPAADADRAMRALEGLTASS